MNQCQNQGLTLYDFINSRHWGLNHFPPRNNLHGGGAAIAQWIHLRLPSCHPGFKSQAHNLCFFQFVLSNCKFVIRVGKWKEQKEAGIGTFLKNNLNSLIKLFLKRRTICPHFKTKKIREYCLAFISNDKIIIHCYNSKQAFKFTKFLRFFVTVLDTWCIPFWAALDNI